MGNARRRVVYGAVTAGLLAGAAGTTALDMVTYLDQALRGRPASVMPQRVAERLAGIAGVPLGEGDEAAGRAQGVGGLLGILTGLAVGAAYGALRTAVPRPSPLVAAAGLGVAVVLASGGPMTALGLTDPRTWGVAGWLSDLVPHFTYGLVTAYTFDVITAAGRPGCRP
ncbi:hypothetical protein ABGB17_16475 [Sphaerisporangium sp. B11E5]|uniref:hypothetical protein n=1 Tax=Sphaerisporangium sp. B11E5 TaxID=3153563 RepID=UPI00325E582B